MTKKLVVAILLLLSTSVAGCSDSQDDQFVIVGKLFANFKPGTKMASAMKDLSYTKKTEKGFGVTVTVYDVQLAPPYHATFAAGGDCRYLIKYHRGDHIWAAAEIHFNDLFLNAIKAQKASTGPAAGNSTVEITIPGRNVAFGTQVEGDKPHAANNLLMYVQSDEEKIFLNRFKALTKYCKGQT